MISDKEMKKTFRVEASENYEIYFPVKSLKEKGYTRYECNNCKKFFWSIDKRDVCGETDCIGGYEEVKNKKKMSFVDVWLNFSKLMKTKGYTPINRYPVVARWNPTTEFTIASITAFQPYVVTGEIDPPANPLTIPQLCLRFIDFDNIGYTGRHSTGFTMIGQHGFFKKEDYDINKLFNDYYDWYETGLGLKKEELIIHEDSWAGGGNFGPCMEFFSGGIELGNQVYMLFEQTETGRNELKIKVLDMGMGQERIAWFCNGTLTMYDACMPKVCDHLFKITNVKRGELFEKFAKYSGLLNIDEVDDIEKVWSDVAKEIGTDSASLKEGIDPIASIYQIADHTRTLLYALTDGAIPSNAGGGYNLRVLYRKVRNNIEKYSWNIDLKEVIKMHAQELEKEYPELLEKLDLVYKILDVEERKYNQNKLKNKKIIESLITKDLTIKDFISQYDSNGITPEEIKEAAKEVGKNIEIPSNFYGKISELHEQSEQKTATKKNEVLSIENATPTVPVYFEDTFQSELKSKVQYVSDDLVVLDKTIFYPTSGGQLHDIGKLNDFDVVDVFKQGNIIIHKVKDHDFKIGDEVLGKIDLERRKQIAQHHTATHVINASAKAVLGEHIWQAGAAKTMQKGRLDITHFDNLTEKEIKLIEDEANKIIEENLEVKKDFQKRDDAEKKYGFTLYQGGAVPGKELRIVNIGGIDVEACGGTHLDSTKQIEKIKIIKTSKLQDGVVRIEFVAGPQAKKEESSSKDIIAELTKLLNCSEKQIPARCEELFLLWKKLKKAKKKKAELPKLNLVSTNEYDDDVLSEASKILKTQNEHLIKTVKRFIADFD